MATTPGGKGVVAEEALRKFFLSEGYFVVRGIPVTYRDFDVTDVDLWLYAKPTPTTAERVCVDIKRKRTPQAMERVLWTKGLKHVLNVNRAIVVTTDSRPETRDFGTAHGIAVMQGDFLQRTISTFNAHHRMAEEELFSVLRVPCVVDSSLEWRSWFRAAKARLLNSLNFDGCNTFLVAIKLVLDEYIATSKSSEVAVRLLYAITAYFLICLDYTCGWLLNSDDRFRNLTMIEGFRYGEAGRERTDEIVHMATRLLEVVGQSDHFSREALLDEFRRQASEYHAEILAEHFSKIESLRSLFVLARALEERAYSKILTRPNECTSEERAVIGLICDFCRRDRKAVI